MKINNLLAFLRQLTNVLTNVHFNLSKQLLFSSNTIHQSLRKATIFISEHECNASPYEPVSEILSPLVLRKNMLFTV